MTKLGEFLRDDAGAVTIDWVALAAGTLLVGMAIVYAVFGGGVDALITNINQKMLGADLTMDCAGDADGKVTCSGSAA